MEVLQNEEWAKGKVVHVSKVDGRVSVQVLDTKKVVHLSHDSKSLRPRQSPLERLNENSTTRRSILKPTKPIEEEHVCIFELPNSNFGCSSALFWEKCSRKEEKTLFNTNRLIKIYICKSESGRFAEENFAVCCLKRNEEDACDVFEI